MFLSVDNAIGALYNKEVRAIQQSISAPLLIAKFISMYTYSCQAKFTTSPFHSINEEMYPHLFIRALSSRKYYSPDLIACDSAKGRRRRRGE